VTSTDTSTQASSTQDTTSQTTQTTQQASTVITSVITSESGGVTRTIYQTSTAPAETTQASQTAASSSASASTTAGLQSSGKSSSSGLGTGGTVAVAVVVPIVAVALLVLLGLYLWRKRKARKDAEELRRKEVEEYGYNPNNDPTLPAVAGSAGHDGAYEMREDGSSGYRGWGTTAVASSGRKGSTTLSGGNSAGGIGVAHSGETSPTHGPSDAGSNNALMGDRPLSGEPGEAEALGQMGPAASGNRSDINRGPSNASSSYSAANRSDGSGEGGPYYNNNQYDSGNPYGTEQPYGSPPGRAEMSGQPIIRDVQARRNTRIENPSHFPQQSSGIAQNF